MLDLTIDQLKVLFIHYQHDEEAVVWLRSKEYGKRDAEEKQVFLSNNYERIWQRSRQEIIEHPERWYDYLHPENYELWIQRFNERLEFMNDPTDDGLWLFQTIQPDGSRSFMNSTCYRVIDNQDNPIGFFGWGYNLSEQSWLQQYEQSRRLDNTQLNDCLALCEKLTRMQPQLIETLSQITEDYKYFYIRTTTDSVEVSRREAQCIILLSQGMTAAKTGKLLFISPRTVERHFENIKLKLDCSTKLEMLAMFNQGTWRLFAE